MSGVEKTREATGFIPVVRVTVNPDGIPSVMKLFTNWVVWKAELKGNERFDKIPHDAKTGKRASTTDSRTWAEFPVALEALKSGDYGGVGFVLSSGDPFVALDFDRCRNPMTGEVSNDVLRYVEQFSKRHVEVSPSGTGLRLVTYGKLRNGMKKDRFEVYGQERFVTMTGEVLDA